MNSDNYSKNRTSIIIVSINTDPRRDSDQRKKKWRKKSTLHDQIQQNLDTECERCWLCSSKRIIWVRQCCEYKYSRNSDSCILYDQANRLAWIWQDSQLQYWLVILVHYVHDLRLWLRGSSLTFMSHHWCEVWPVLELIWLEVLSILWLFLISLVILKGEGPF